MRRLLFLLPFFCAIPAQAVSSHFVDVVEQGLLCHSEWSTEYWISYMNQNLNAPLRDWGQARWWQSGGATLGGVPSIEVFVNRPDAKAYMIGALFSQELKQVKDTIEKNQKIRFKEVKGVDGVRWITPEASVLVAVASPTPQTKWYCARWMLGNRP
ncbi:hypothetical protein KSF73_04610 [Burkholderiaceae bacterium DAT-1]|nr:hypothetical protein [Burkholderiaceae bacterium DAT-1]